MSTSTLSPTTVEHVIDKHLAARHSAKADAGLGRKRGKSSPQVLLFAVNKSNNNNNKQLSC